MTEVPDSVRPGSPRADVEPEAFQALFDRAAIGMTMVDQESGRYVRVNQAFCEITGYTEDELLQRSYLDFTHPDDRPRELIAARAIAEGREGYVREKRYVRKSGDIRWVRVTARLVPTRGTKLFMSVIEDITERKYGELHARFLNDLHRAIAPVRDPKEIARQVLVAIAEHLQVDLAFGEVPRGTAMITVEQEYRDGVPSRVGTHCGTDYFTAEVWEALLNGADMIVADVAADARTAASAQAFGRFHVAAFVAVPLVNAHGLLATLSVASRQPRAWRPDEVKLLQDVSARLFLAVERARAEKALRESQSTLAAELADTQQLQRISTQLIHEDVGGLYELILDGAIAVTRADGGSLQMLDAEKSEFCLLACRGLDAAAAQSWQRVRAESAGSASGALTAGKRVILPDAASLELTPAERDRLRASGIRAMQSTPLVSREGRVLGMISTHWRDIHEPVQRELRLLDVLARQAADLLERRRAGEALRYRGEQFRTLLNQAPLGVFLVDADFRMAEVNPVAQALFTGIPGLIGRDFDEVIHIRPGGKYAEQLVRIFRATLQTGEPFVVPEAQRLNADTGATEYYEWRVDRILLPDGRHGVVCYYRDVSEHVRTREALQAADRRKDEFLATLAHELRNPLAPVRNAVEILRRKGPHDPQVQATQDIIERQVKHMVRLIDDLLEISRITRGKLELRTERTTLERILDEAVETARPHLGHQLVTALPEETIYLEADVTRLAQVFSNLLNNACKYTPKGGRIALSAEREGESLVVVKVSDDGIGIAPGDLPRVFDMFSQVQSTLDRAQGGLGIGLSLAKGLVELHRGSIEARSAGVGKGSEFTVRLPALARLGGHTPEARVDAPEQRHRSARRILVVDDNEDSARSLADLLALDGNQVETAYDGPEAVAKASAFKPEVILLDIGLPKMNGYDACRAIRTQDWAKQTTIVALTGWGQAGDRRRSLQAGFDGHLVKPVDHASLLDAIERPRPSDRQPS